MSPLAAWIHPLSGKRVPLDYFDTDTSCAGRPAFSPALARLIVVNKERDLRHRRMGITVSRCLTCPRQTILELLFPYAVNPREIAKRELGTLQHAGVAPHWNPNHYFAEDEDHTVVAGELFGGVPVSTKIDMMRFAPNATRGGGDGTQGPPQIVEIGDNKFPNDKSAWYRGKPQSPSHPIGLAKFDHGLQLNMMRLLLAQQPWAVEGGYDADKVLLTIYDYACGSDPGDGPVPLEVPHMSEDEILASKPLVGQPGEKYFKREVWERAATVYDIVCDQMAAEARYAQLSPEMRRERAVIEERVIGGAGDGSLRLIGQRGMLGNKMCTHYCEVAGICGEIARKLGARL